MSFVARLRLEKIQVNGTGGSNCNPSAWAPNASASGLIAAAAGGGLQQRAAIYAVRHQDPFDRTLCLRDSAHSDNPPAAVLLAHRRTKVRYTDPLPSARALAS